MSMRNNLLSSPKERNIRREKKLRSVLRFLRQQLWSTQEILQQVMELGTRQAAHKSLVQFESELLLKRYSLQALGGSITLWGITSHGQAMAFNIDNEDMINAYFEPSRISEQNIRHQLDLQQLRITAEIDGWKNWRDGDRLGTLDKDTKRPDAIAINLDGQLVAIECERSFKSYKRYSSVLLSYLKLIKSNEISGVVWVSPTQDFSDRLKVIITSIKTLKIAGQIVTIDPSKHHVNLHFCTYADWPYYL